MATHYKSIATELKHFNHIRKYLPRFEELDSRTLDILAEWGALQVSTLVELAIAHSADLDVISADEHDLNDGSEVKMATVRMHNYGKSYGANISNTKNKSGLIRAQVHEPKTDIFYYFAIPHHAHSIITSKSSNIEIPFYLDGTPKRNYKAKLHNWWNYEVLTFQDMCEKSNSQQ